MTTYNYLEKLKEDVKTAILDKYAKEEIKQNFENLESRDVFSNKLYDDLFVDDNVTGNASGSYTFSIYIAEEHLCHNFDLLQEALECFGYSGNDAFEKGAEFCDVTIRCYLLGSAIREVLDDLEEEF